MCACVFRQKDHRDAKSQLVVATINWFHERLLRFDKEHEDSSGKLRALTLAELRKLAVEYVARHDLQTEAAAESEAKAKASGKTKKADPRESLRQDQITSERNELRTNGLSVPDLTRSENCTMVREWTDEASAIPRISFIRVIASDELQVPAVKSVGKESEGRSAAQILASGSRKRTRGDQEMKVLVESESDAASDSDSDSEVEICIKRSRPSLD